MASTGFLGIGVNLDSTSNVPGTAATAGSNTGNIQPMMTSVEGFQPSLGFHFIQAMETAISLTPTFVGGSATTPVYQTQALTVELEM
jgi:hypothetical protein